MKKLQGQPCLLGLEDRVAIERAQCARGTWGELQVDFHELSAIRVTRIRVIRVMKV